MAASLSHDESISGLRSRSKGSNEIAQPRQTASVTHTADDDEYPLDWLKRVLLRALWSQRYFWSVASLCILTDIFFNTLVILAVRCE